MTLFELSELVKAPIKVMSGYNNKVFCRRFIPKKHLALSGRSILSVWAEVEAKTSGFSQYIVPIICVHVDGTPEYDAKQKG